jgi:hypothetical protein
MIIISDTKHSAMMDAYDSSMEPLAVIMAHVRAVEAEFCSASLTKALKITSNVTWPVANGLPFTLLSATIRSAQAERQACV